MSLCRDYQELLRAKLEQDEIQSHYSISDFLHSTNNKRFSAEKAPIKTHYRHHHRSKHSIQLIVGVVGDNLDLLFTGGVSVFNTIKGAQMSS